MRRRATSFTCTWVVGAGLGSEWVVLLSGAVCWCGGGGGVFSISISVDWEGGGGGGVRNDTPPRRMAAM